LKVFLLNGTYEFIKNEAVDCIIRYNMQYPLNPFELAQKMGIKSVPYSILAQSQYSEALKCSPDGFSCENSTTTLIFYNSTANPRRMLQTIAHEIGHIKLDHSAGFLRSEIEEHEAKFFAKYIMAPPPLIHQLKVINASTIKENFNLSAEAAGYALTYYNHWFKQFQGNFKDYELKLLNYCKYSKQHS
jgi:Zn-dependent peptidase ImmA (M78 family)